MDTDTGLMMFYQRCVDAGLLACPLYAPTANEVGVRIEHILESLRTDPISFYDPSSKQYGLVDYSLVKRALFAAMYTPENFSSFLFIALAHLEVGEVAMIWAISGQGFVHDLITQPCSCPAPDSGERDNLTGGWDAMFAIACGDAEEVGGDVKELRRNFEKLSKQSVFADCWGVQVSCS